jgi:hypothetical protein
MLDFTILQEPTDFTILQEPVSFTILQEPISFTILSDVTYCNFETGEITTLSYFDSLPIFTSNQVAIAGGYLGMVYKTPENKVLVGINQTPFTLNLSKAWSYFRRIF